MAASKDRIVSSGRSDRGRVGFDQSGSAATRTQGLVWRECGKVEMDGNGNAGDEMGREHPLTNEISILIFMLKISQRAHRGLLECNVIF